VKKGTGFLSFLLIPLLVGCGKKGPPLPPLIKLPTAPGDFAVQRRGMTVAIQFVLPGSNTDGSTPADLNRVEVYALTGPPTLTPDEILRRGTRVGRVPANPPPDPDAPEGEPARPDASVPGGLDQGATARLSDAFRPPPTVAPADVRSYIAVGFNKRGRRGAFSRPVPVPIGDAPPAPQPPRVTWDETSITVTWPTLPSATDSSPTYNVYVPGEVEVRLTEHPLNEASFVDRRIEWGAERCYVIRAVETVDSLALESEASPPACVTLADTFPPAAPGGLITVAAEGAVNLIWDPNNEADLAGYLVLRAVAPSPDLVPITPSPVLETTFKDVVPAGARVTYAVQAVDKAGNVSPMSARVEETAR
jgi:hypothetical protein